MSLRISSARSCGSTPSFAVHSSTSGSFSSTPASGPARACIPPASGRHTVTLSASPAALPWNNSRLGMPSQVLAHVRKRNAGPACNLSPRARVPYTCLLFFLCQPELLLQVCADRSCKQCVSLER